GEIAVQHFHRRDLPHALVLDFVDHPHSAPPDNLDHAVAVVDDSAEPYIARIRGATIVASPSHLRPDAGIAIRVPSIRLCLLAGGARVLQPRSAVHIGPTRPAVILIEVVAGTTSWAKILRRRSAHARRA